MILKIHRPTPEGLPQAFLFIVAVIGFVVLKLKQRKLKHPKASGNGFNNQSENVAITTTGQLMTNSGC